MKTIAWNVYLNGRLIDTVFYDADCDHWYVKNGLINHDGYNSAIIVKRARYLGDPVSIEDYEPDEPDYDPRDDLDYDPNEDLWAEPED